MQEMVRQLTKECEFQIELISALISENIYFPAFFIFFILYIILLNKSLKQWFTLLFTLKQDKNNDVESYKMQ